MKKTNLYLLSSLVGLFAFSGCETTTSQVEVGEMAVRLDGNKFDHGNCVRRAIRFEGSGGALYREDDLDSKGVPFSFYRDQVFDERDAEFDSGRKVSANYFIVDDFSWNGGGEGDGYFEVFSTMPLRGYAIQGKHDGSRWTYSLKNRRADPVQRDALDGIIYILRALYPKTAMRVGANWTHSPLFVNAYLRREIRDVVGAVKLTLLRVGEVNGEQSAVIGLDLESSGDEVREDGSVAIAKIALKGEIVLSLETSIELKGEMTGSLVDDGRVSLYTSPIQIVASESFFESEGFSF